MSLVLRSVFALFVLLAIAEEAVAAVSTDDKAPLIIGVLPRRDAVETERLFKPLAEYLGTRLGRRVVLEPAKDFATFWKAVTERRYHLVHYNALQYVKSHRQFGYRIVAKNEERGESTIAGVLVVRKDGPIDDIKQLRGKKIAFGGDRDAMVTYILPTLLLRRAGLKAGDYTEIFVKNPANGVTLTYIGETEASGASNMALQRGFVENVDGDRLRILAQSEALPQLPWAVTDRMEPQLRVQLTHLLIGLRNEPSGRAVLRNARLTALVPATNKEYDVYRRLMKELENAIPQKR